MDTDRHTELEAMLDRWEEARGAGTTLTPDDLCPSDPSLRGELQRRLSVLSAFDLLRPTSAAADAGPLPRLSGYTLKRELGRGGMGVVYLARQEALGRTVALKFLPFTESTAAEYRQRFQQEAQALAHLQHPHIVQVFEVGTHEGRPFMALEYVAGGTLAAAWNRRHQDPRAVATLAETLARAIAYAHSRGVLHRDLKPANVLIEVSRDTQRSGLIPKVSDFGLAKLLADSDLKPQAQTQSGSVMGTPSYMAPEQAKGDTTRIGPAADIYGLGAILYEGLTGQPPFEGASLFETVQQVVTQEPRPPRKLNPAVPLDVETITLRCLRKEPDQRFTSALDLAEELGRFLRGEPIVSRPVSMAERMRRWVGRNPKLAAALSVATLLLLATAGVSLVFARHAQRSAADLRQALADTYRTRGQALCEQGETDVGRLWLLRALAAIPDLGMQRELRRDLSQWEQQSPRLLGAMQLKQMGWAGFKKDGLNHYAVGGTDFLACSFSGTSGVTHPADSLGREVSAFCYSPVTATMYFAVAEADGNGAGLLRVDDRGRPAGSEQRLPSIAQSLAASPDGTTLAVGLLPEGGLRGAGRLVLYPRAAESCPTPSLERDGWPLALSYSPDGSTLAILFTRPFGDNASELLLLDAVSGKLKGSAVQLPEPADGTVTGQLNFAPDGQSVWVATGRKVRRIAVADGKLLDQIASAQAFAPAVAFSGDGKEIFLAEGSLVRGYAVGGGQAVTPILRHSARVVTVALSQDGRHLLAGAADGSIRLWELRHRLEDRLPAAVTATAFDEVLLAADADGHVLLKSPGRDDGYRLKLLDRVSQVVSLPQVDLGVAWLTCEKGRVIHELQLGTGSLTGRKLVHPAYVHGVIHHAEAGQLLTACSDGLIRRWDLASAREVSEPLRYEGPVRWLNLQVGGQEVIAFESSRKAVSVTNLKDRTRRVIPVPEADILLGELARSPNGDWLALRATGECVLLVNLRFQRQERLQMGTGGKVQGLAFSPDGHELAVAGADGGVRLWRTQDWKLHAELRGHSQTVTHLAFSNDGQRLYTGGRDRQVRGWNVRTGQPDGVPWLLPERVASLKMHSQRPELLCGCTDGSVRLMRVDGIRIDRSLPQWGHDCRLDTGINLDEAGGTRVFTPAQWRDMQTR